MADNGRSPSAIAGAIERYVASHPEAADTVAGIRHWWLPATCGETPEGVIEAALADLVSRGAIVSTRLPDGRVLYARGRAGRDDGRS